MNDARVALGLVTSESRRGQVARPGHREVKVLPSSHGVAQGLGVERPGGFESRRRVEFPTAAVC